MAKGENKKILRAKNKAHEDNKRRKRDEQTRIDRSNSIIETLLKAGEPPITIIHPAPSNRAYRL